jgi:DNA replication protein DnaC
LKKNDRRNDLDNEFSKSFEFDHIFWKNETQEEIFKLVAPLVKHELDGNNICIFTYGQTGSGKTKTSRILQKRFLNF